MNAEPTSAEAWGRLGEIYDIHRFGVQALTCYEQASKIDPDEWLCRYFSGIVARENDQAASVAYFERAIELNPDHAPTHLYIGAAYLLLEDLDRSEEHFARAMELDQASINARIGLGRIALARGEAEKAVTILEEAVRLAPREAASHHNLAQDPPVRSAKTKMPTARNASRSTVRYPCSPATWRPSWTPPGKRSRCARVEARCGCSRTAGE